jgi:hypothetical protein
VNGTSSIFDPQITPERFCCISVDISARSDWTTHQFITRQKFVPRSHEGGPNWDNPANEAAFSTDGEVVIAEYSDGEKDTLPKQKQLR